MFFSCMPRAQVIREWARTALGPGATGQSVAPREYLVMLRAAVDASLSPNDATYSDDSEALLLDGLIRWLTDTQQFGAPPLNAGLIRHLWGLNTPAGWPWLFIDTAGVRQLYGNLVN